MPALGSFHAGSSEDLGSVLPPSLCLALLSVLTGGSPPHCICVAGRSPSAAGIRDERPWLVDHNEVGAHWFCVVHLQQA